MGLGGAYTRRYRGGRTVWASWRRLPLRYFHIFYCFNVCVTNRHHGRHGLLSATGAKLVSMERFFFSLLRFLRVLGINIIFCYLAGGTRSCTQKLSHSRQKANSRMSTTVIVLCPYRIEQVIWDAGDIAFEDVLGPIDARTTSCGALSRHISTASVCERFASVHPCWMISTRRSSPSSHLNTSSRRKRRTLGTDRYIWTNNASAR